MTEFMQCYGAMFNYVLWEVPLVLKADETNLLKKIIFFPQTFWLGLEPKPQDWKGTNALH